MHQYAGDRHVLACAIEANAPLILTYNEKHFRPEHLEPWNIRRMHPQDYLEALFAKDPSAVLEQLDMIADEKKLSRKAVLLRLVEPAPRFAKQLLAALG